MKFTVATLLIILLAFVSGLFFPWWAFVIPVFITAALIHQKPGKAFLSGFLGLFLLWGGMAMFIDQQNGGVLATKVAEILKLGNSSVMLVIITAIVGALIGGFASLSGSYLRKTS